MHPARTRSSWVMAAVVAAVALTGCTGGDAAPDPARSPSSSPTASATPEAAVEPLESGFPDPPAALPEGVADDYTFYKALDDPKYGATTYTMSHSDGRYVLHSLESSGATPKPYEFDKWIREGTSAMLAIEELEPQDWGVPSQEAVLRDPALLQSLADQVTARWGEQTPGDISWGAEVDRSGPLIDQYGNPLVVVDFFSDQFGAHTAFVKVLPDTIVMTTAEFMEASQQPLGEGAAQEGDPYSQRLAAGQETYALFGLVAASVHTPEQEPLPQYAPYSAVASD